MGPKKKTETDWIRRIIDGVPVVWILTEVAFQRVASVLEEASLLHIYNRHPGLRT